MKTGDKLYCIKNLDYYGLSIKKGKLYEISSIQNEINSFFVFSNNVEFGPFNTSTPYFKTIKQQRKSKLLKIIKNNEE